MSFQDWFVYFGWSDNPFKVRPDPQNIVGFIDMRTQILTYMRSDDPFIVTGPTGAGKTTLLKWVEKHKDNSIYFNFLNDIDENEFKKRIEGGFLERLRNLFSDVKKTILIDEVQEMSPELLKWTRGKFDEGKISSLVLASIKEDLENLEDPFLERIGKRIVFVRNLTEDEAFKMVKQRMFTKGKNNPFTDTALRKIFEFSNFSPRKILENCEACCIYAFRERLRYINEDLVNKAINPKITFNKEKTPKVITQNLKNLSPVQQKIIKLLSEREMTTKQIAEELGASRASIAKQLSRLSFKTDRKLLESKGISSPLVEVKNKGRPVIYGLTKNAKELLEKL